MDFKLITWGIILLAIILTGLFIFSGSHPSPATQINSTTGNNNGNSSGNQTNNSSKTLFSSTQYFPYSYQIYPGPISQQAQSALTGFNFTYILLPNSTTNVTLSLSGTNQYHSMMLKPNYKLYVIETTFGDDGFHFDSSLSDDGFIIVDPNGYIA